MNKKLTLIALIMIIIGLFTAITGFVADRDNLVNNFNNLDLTKKQTAIENSENVKNIDIKVKNGNVVLVPILKEEMDQNRIQLYRLNYKGNDLKTEIENDTLKITETTTAPRSAFSLISYNDSNDLRVYVPRKLFDSIKAHSDNGDVKSETVYSKKFDYTSKRGDIKILDTTPEEINANTTFGDIDLELRGSMNDYNTEEVKTFYGKVKAPLGLNGSKPIKATTSNGDVEIDFR